ncbi:DNA polymerase Y family protein [Nakamurella lactea]|uniref:DNA polymerase Y family protein n=1 Tax=Nakamurella lactea TaxID=459515 RepID=UPI000413DDCC|nr:DNA polymerase Y family protein [Nakamurella lactea]
MVRTLVVWCPDWPAVAAAQQARKPATGPVAVFHANRVQACTAAARADGIRIGMRRREAQSRCPELVVLPVDHDAAGRAFESVAAAVEAVAPGIEVLRPGMIACPARGPRRYFGSENAAAERIVDAVEALDVEARVGIADVLPVAVLAARQQRIVPVGDAAEFCAGLPIAELARDPAISPPERAGLVDLLVRLGITTVGAFAALPQERVATRFGPDALLAHRLAHGLAERGISRRSIPQDRVIEQVCDPPLDRVDTAAFLGRALAERFHAGLADAGLACTRLAISARTERGRTLRRVWRSARPLTPAATADRLRWQLEGWLTSTARRDTARQDAVRSGSASDPTESAGPGAIIALRLEPIEAVDAGRVQYGLWGSDGEDDHRAGWAFARVQGLLGPESVLTPVLSGGRTPGDRVTLVSWGDERVPARDPAAPWPGALPAPSPTRLADPSRPGGQQAGRERIGATRRVELLDDVGRPVLLTGRGLLSATPVAVDGRQIAGWAGPWLVDERWWEPNQPPASLVAAPPQVAARMQVLCRDGPVLLLRYLTAASVQSPAQPWQIEGVYD